jgi:exodeoxyribonuclease V alpha subunit
LLFELAGGSLPWPLIDLDEALLSVAERLFADSQTDAIRQALGCKVPVITGGPGIGKTTILKATLVRSAKAIHRPLKGKPAFCR